MGKLNFGIWGCGMVSKSHVAAINNIEDANLYGFFDLNKDAMESSAKANNAKAYDCLEDFLGDDNIDVITICLPSGLHCETAHACLKAGKHVLVEKPLTLDIETADELIAESEKPGKHGKYICIEPWCGVPDFEGTSYDFTEKIGINKLDGKESFSRIHTITLEK